MSGTQRVCFGYKGLFLATVTPMKDNGDIYYDAIPQYVEHLIHHRMAGIYVNGTAGEGVSMTLTERKATAEKWISLSKGKLKTIVHCGGLSLRDAKELAAHAELIGADAIATIPSFYFPPLTVGALVTQMQEVASAAPNTPFIYYHIPRLTHVDLDMSMFLKLGKAKIPTLCGLKYSGLDLQGALKCTAEYGKEFDIMCGRDDVLLGALAMGFKSSVGSSYCLTAPIANHIVELFESGDFAGAEAEQLRLKKIMDLTETFGDSVSTLKALTTLAGIPAGPTRLPLKALGPTEIKHLENGLEKLGVFRWITECVER